MWRWSVRPQAKPHTCVTIPGLIKPRPRRRSLMARDQTIGRGVKPLRVAHHGDWLIRVGAGRRPSCAVDHIQDATVPGCGEEDCQQIAEASRRKSGGDLKGVCSVDVHALVEEAVAAHTVSL